VAAGPVVDQLAVQYADQNVLFIEQDVDMPVGGRMDRWWRGWGVGGTVYLPLSMVDSGHQVTQGAEEWSSVFAAMVDASLLRDAAARLEVATERIGNVVRFDIDLTNLSGTTLAAATNGATVTAMIYKDTAKASSKRVVKAAATAPVLELANGATGEYMIAVAAADVDWDDARWVVIADYQPAGANQPYDTLQAVMGQ
jgi:hypothetical protein